MTKNRRHPSHDAYIGSETVLDRSIGELAREDVAEPAQREAPKERYREPFSGMGSTNESKSAIAIKKLTPEQREARDKWLNECPPLPSNRSRLNFSETRKGKR